MSVVSKCALREKRLPLEGKLATKLTDEVLLARNSHLIHRKRSPFPSRGRLWDAFETTL